MGQLRGIHLDSDQRHLVEVAVQAGWTVMATRRHVRLIPSDPAQAIVVMGATPSDHRWLRNTRAKLRRSGLAV
jgi:hypothetical protein